MCLTPWIPCSLSHSRAGHVNLYFLPRGHREPGGCTSNQVPHLLYATLHLGMCVCLLLLSSHSGHWSLQSCLAGRILTYAGDTERTWNAFSECVKEEEMVRSVKGRRETAGGRRYPNQGLFKITVKTDSAGFPATTLRRGLLQEATAGPGPSQRS